jgi:hypothetical protein
MTAYYDPAFFNRGVIVTNFHRLRWRDRLRFSARMIKRRLQQRSGRAPLLTE